MSAATGVVISYSTEYLQKPGSVRSPADCYSRNAHMIFWIVCALMDCVLSLSVWSVGAGVPQKHGQGKSFANCWKLLHQLWTALLELSSNNT